MKHKFSIFFRHFAINYVFSGNSSVEIRSVMMKFVVLPRLQYLGQKQPKTHKN